MLFNSELYKTARTGSCGCCAFVVVVVAKIDLKKMPEYALVFEAQKIESPVEDIFLSKGGSLGAAAARADTDFALTHSPVAVSSLVVDAPSTVSLPLPGALVDECSHIRVTPTTLAGPTIVLPDRARLNMSSSLTATGINGTLVSSLAGQASVRLADLFTHLELDKVVTSATNVSDAAAPADVRARPAPRTVSGKVVPFQYGAWGAHRGVLQISNARIMRVHGRELVPVSVVFHKDAKIDAEVAKVEPVMQGIYNRAWSMLDLVPFPPSHNLTKSVFKVPCGLNASGYSLAAEVNNTPPSYTDEALEAMMTRCLLSECGNDASARDALLTALAVPSVTATITFGERIATAISAFQAFTMPYRVDGAPVVNPDGVKMRQAESWRGEATRSILQADDCDGSAASSISIVRRACELEADASTAGKYPAMRAIANSIGAHYVYGTCVLAANAGHADAADATKKAAVAGHAIALAVPKLVFLMGLESGSAGVLGSATETIVPKDAMEAVANARFKALYPPELIAALPKNELFLLEDYQTAKRTPLAHSVRGLQPFALEGTSYACARLFTHSAEERNGREADFVDDQLSATHFAPHIARTKKVLDTSNTEQKHGFYNSFLELSLPMTTPLFTDPALRAQGVATPHFRFSAPVRAVGESVGGAGASPEALASREFSVVPLWSVGETEAAIIDRAHVEAHANVLPRRAGPLPLTDDQHATLQASMSHLKSLSKALRDYGDDDEGVENIHMLSFASLVGNSEAVGTMVKTMQSAPGIRGRVIGLDEDVEGIAAYGGESVGKLVLVQTLVKI